MYTILERSPEHYFDQSCLLSLHPVVLKKNINQSKTLMTSWMSGKF